MLGDDIEATLPELRAQAESNMATPCELQRPDGYIVDGQNGQRQQLWTTYWTGKCRIRTIDLSSRDSLGGEPVQDRRTVCATPVSSPEPLTGHRYLTDLAAGGAFVVVSPIGSQMVQRRVQVSSEQGVQR